MTSAGDGDLRTFIREIVRRQERSLLAMERRLDTNTDAVRACVAEMAQQRAEMEEQRAEMRAGREALFRMLDRLPPPEPNGA